jgi:hypothetical protein
MPDQSEPEQLYVVAEVYEDEEGQPVRVTVTNPLPKDRAERFARVDAESFGGRLEVVPATQADLDDADGGA